MKISVLFALVVLTALGVFESLRERTLAPSEAVVVLLIPDAKALESELTHAWLDAAREEGLRILPLTDDEYLSYARGHAPVAGIILPDGVHSQASGLMVDALGAYVQTGGALMVTFDAGMLISNNHAYAVPRSRLSDIVGVDYGLYEALRGKSVGSSPIQGTFASETELGVQPGKLDFVGRADRRPGELTTYGYKRLTHNFYRTRNAPRARVLMHSTDGDVVVSKNAYGKGEVLFVNLALGYLKTRTDGYLLHQFLRHFVVDMAHQPYLSGVPGGVGGFVLNLHIDSNSARAPLLRLEESGWFDGGPFSLHVTAGPDTYAVGDGQGVNVDNNAEMRGFLRRMQAKGHEIGDHGGWIHNVFGLEASESNRATYEPYLDANDRSLRQLLNRPPRTYSAPVGNHPTWVTHWLGKNDFKAYYFTGDTGLGPTRAYFEGMRPKEGLWAFPVSHFIDIATFEELDSDTSPGTAAEMKQFLSSLLNYAADHRVARLFYFHPHSATGYEGAIMALRNEGDELARTGRFRWYTMETLADFMSRRELAQWRTISSAKGNETTFTATSPGGLAELTWMIPGTDRSRPLVRQGTATLRQAPGMWIVTAGACDDLEVVFEEPGTIRSEQDGKRKNSSAPASPTQQPENTVGQFHDSIVPRHPAP